MNWIEMDIATSSVGIDPLCGCLLNIGVTGFSIADPLEFQAFLEDKTGNWDYIDDELLGLRDKVATVTIYLPENSQGSEMLSMIKNELVALKSRDEKDEFGTLEYSFKNIKEEDWANNWKQYFKPFGIGEKLYIKPSWESAENSGDRKILEIDPASSFGTGQHHTTKLCLELLEKVVENGDTILDLGCGSGILSIGGILLGGKSAVAIDIEENAVTTSVENANKNGILTEQYVAYRGDVVSDLLLREKIGTGFDIITANIVADVLINMSGIFGEFLKENGKLILSGIISERQDEVIDAVTEKGFSVLEIATEEGWSAVLLENRK